MSDKDHVKRLEQLAALREAGALTEEEFAAAKNRVLAGDVPTEVLEEQVQPTRARGPYWAAGGVVAILLLGTALFATNIGATTEPDQNAAEMAVEPLEEAAATEAPVVGGEICGSQENYAQIKDMAFEQAAEVFGGDPVPLNSLKRTVSVRMQYPVVKAVDETLQRTDCSGRLLIDLPPGVREHFQGAKTLESDVEFSVQPSADGNGFVINAEGFGYTVNQLAAAAALLNATRIAAAGGPQVVPTYNPSFDCGKRLSNVERMICQDEQLSQWDRALSDRYFELKRGLPAAAWRLVSASQREFIQYRGQCADVSCVREAYADQARRIEEIAEGNDEGGAI